MKNQNAKANKLLTYVLLATVAFDLSGRISGQTEVASAELASSGDCDLAGQYAKGDGKSREASCQIVTRDGGKDYKHDAKATWVKKKVASDRVADASNPATEKDVLVIAVSCAECEGKTASYEADANQLGAFSEIRKKMEELSLTLTKDAKAAAEKRKKDEAAAAKLEKEVAACNKSEDGKALSSADRLECKIGKLSSDDTKEVRAAFTDVQSQLRQMLASTDEATRSKGLELLKSIDSSSLPKDLRGTLPVMERAAFYQNETIRAATAMSALPASSPARMFHMQRLGSLFNQMESEFGTARQAAYMGQTSSTTMNEITYWEASLAGSMQAAIAGRSVFSSSGAARGNLDVDLDINGRILRGLPGDRLMNQQQDFSNLALNRNGSPLNGNYSNSYIDQQRNGLLQQGGQRFNPGPGQQGFQSQQVRPGFPQAQQQRPGMPGQLQNRGQMNYPGFNNGQGGQIPAPGQSVGNW